MNPLRRVLLVATFVSGIFVRTARAGCLLPSVVTADVGVNVSEIQSKVLAPASATVLDDTGATCFTIDVTATVTITQVYPELVYTQTGTHLGEYTVTLEAPAQAGSCYNSAINARSAGATATDSDGPVCHTDAAWSSLLLWEDLNHDGISDPGELVPISRSDILLLGTEYDYTPRLDANGNALRYRSYLRERHRTAPYYDVFFLSER